MLFTILKYIKELYTFSECSAERAIWRIALVTGWNNVDSEMNVKRGKKCWRMTCYSDKWMLNIELGREINEKMKNKKILVYT